MPRLHDSLLRRVLALSLAVLLMSACTENQLHAQGKLTEGGSDTGRATDSEGETGTPDDTDPPEASTEPRTCDSVLRALEAEARVDPSCASPVEPIDDPWDLAVEWKWSTRPSAPGLIYEVAATPVVADLNADGVPDIVVVASTDVIGESRQGVLLALDGQTGLPWLEVEGFTAHTNPSIGDVDGDGRLDIVAMGNNMRLRALSADGTELWESHDTSGLLYQHSHVVDLDGDGRTEVVGGQLILDGETGDTLAKLPNDTGRWIISTGAIADLDQDGHQEIIHQGSVYDSSGSLLWEMELSDGDVFAVAVVQANASPGLELAVVGSTEYALFGPSGERLVSQQIHHAMGRMAPPCVADFDGDGTPEVGIPAGRTLYLAELDGSVYADATVSDTSSNAGCAGFDFDGDGSVEVVYADEDALRILDGRTGRTLIEHTAHESGTLVEYPSIADVDGDGAAELVVSSNGRDEDRWKGVTVLGHPSGSWQEASPDWLQYGRHDPGLNTYNAKAVFGEPLPNLSVELVDVCLTGCLDEDEALVSVQVSNTGGRDAHDVELTLLANSGGELTWVADHRLDVPAATSAASLELRLPAHALGTDGLTIRVDASDGILECDETDNEVSWSASCE